MRKKVFGRHLSRSRRSRTALFRSLMKAMVLHGKVETTRAKAKAVIGDLDELMNYVSDGSVTARRAVLAKLANDREMTEMLFKKYQKLADTRKSGFTRLALLNSRKGDAAEMVSLSWVEEGKDENISSKGKRS